MPESSCISLILGLLVLMLQVTGTAESNVQRSILEHPFLGNVSCSSICPPEKSRDKDIVFCRDNCQDYWNRMISAIFADPSGLVNRTTDCTQHNFTHVPSNNVILCSNFRDFSNSTDNEKKFWSRNCISYFICMIGKSVLSNRNISSSSSATTTSSPLTPISVTDQPDQSSQRPWVILLIVLGTLCVVLCVGLTAMIIHRRKTPRHPQGDEPRDELAIQLSTGLLANELVPRNPANNATSEQRVEPGAESTGLPVQEVGDISLSTGASLTTPKETYSTNIVSLRSDPCTEINTETQQNPLEGFSSLGPRSVPLDVSVETETTPSTTEEDL